MQAVDFDPTPLPHRSVDWRRAFAAIACLGEQVGHDEKPAPEAIQAFRLAIEGDQGEATFQRFLGLPGAPALLAERPELADTLDDWDALERLPAGSLGRRYAALARADGIRVAEIASEVRGVEGERERAPDAARRWYRDRLGATHDLLHTLTGYARDVPGETALLAFSYGMAPLRVFSVSLALALLGAPKRQLLCLGRDCLAAWRRGRRADVPLDLRWEALLPLPFADAQAHLRIAPMPGANAGQGPDPLGRSTLRASLDRQPLRHE